MKTFMLIIREWLFSKSKFNSKIEGKLQKTKVTFTVLSKEEVESDRCSAYGYLL